jgi:hypothetical protein
VFLTIFFFTERIVACFFTRGFAVDCVKAIALFSAKMTSNKAHNNILFISVIFLRRFATQPSNLELPCITKIRNITREPPLAIFSGATLVRKLNRPRLTAFKM